MREVIRKEMFSKNFLCAAVIALIALTAAGGFVLPSRAYARSGGYHYDNYCRDNYRHGGYNCHDGHYRGNNNYRNSNYRGTKIVNNTQHHWLWPLPSTQRSAQSQLRYYRAHNRTGYVHTTHPRHYSRPSRR